MSDININISFSKNTSPSRGVKRKRRHKKSRKKQQFFQKQRKQMDTSRGQSAAPNGAGTLSQRLLHADAPARTWPGLSAPPRFLTVKNQSNHEKPNEPVKTKLGPSAPSGQKPPKPCIPSAPSGQKPPKPCIPSAPSGQKPPKPCIPSEPPKPCIPSAPSGQKPPKPCIPSAPSGQKPPKPCIPSEPPKPCIPSAPAGQTPAPTKYLAIDCEMVGTGPKGSISQLGRCSIVSYEGDVVYDKFINPPVPVTDYRTRWSGIRHRDLVKATPYSQARKEILKLLVGKVVVGHAIHNDFRVLGYTHPAALTRDTSRIPLLNTKAGFATQECASLKRLTKAVLHRDIQTGRKGHSSVEDAQATMQLYRVVEGEWEKTLALKSQSTK